MSRLRKLYIFVGTVLLFGLFLITISFQHWWLENIGSAIFVNGKYSETGRIFRNSNGDFDHRPMMADVLTSQ